MLSASTPAALVVPFDRSATTVSVAGMEVKVRLGHM
jgi:hypothetical protein